MKPAFAYTRPKMTLSIAHPGPPRRIRLLVVDDQPLIRRGLAVMLATESDIDVVGQAADGEEAIQAARRDRPDVVLMDLQMPRVGGVAATRTISGELPGTQVVVLTTFDTDELVFDAIRAGAQAYLLKDAPESEILDTIRAVHRGESRLSPNIARKVMEQFRLLPARGGDAVPAEAPPAKDDEPASLDALTGREERILALIAEGKSNKEIARTVFLAEGTVKNYVSRIMEKLHARTRTELAVKALRVK
jgi:DNA-binding NarL/FixJ family response regulator